MARLNGISKNLNAFLDMLRWSEGTSTSPITKDEGYDIIVTGVDGKERFDDYSTHPFENRKPKQVNKKGLLSSASGGYQFLKTNWPHYKALLKLPDFSPLSQDKWAIQLIRECKGALQFIEQGRLFEAVNAVRHLWASLPGAGYDQPEHSFAKLTEVYLNKGGSLWDSKPSLSQELPSSQVSSQPSVSVPPKVEPMPIQNETESKPNGLLELIKKLFGRKQT